MHDRRSWMIFGVLIIILSLFITIYPTVKIIQKQNKIESNEYYEWFAYVDDYDIETQ